MQPDTDPVRSRGSPLVQIHTDLVEEELKNYLTLPGERLIIAKRQHGLVLFIPILLTLFLAILSLTVVFLINYYLISSSPFFIISALLILSILTSFIVKIIVDSYFHVYMVTTRRIVEVICQPFFNENIDDVFLDQVRTTEIEVKMDGFINKIFDIGDVVIAFDRPSHDKQYVIKNIRNSRFIGRILSEQLQTMMHDSPIWFQPRKSSDFHKINDDVANGEKHA